MVSSALLWKFQYWSHYNGFFPSFQWRSSNASSCYTSLLQTTDRAASLVLCAEVVSWAPQHVSSLEMQAACNSCFAHQSICSAISSTPACLGQWRPASKGVFNCGRQSLGRAIPSFPYSTFFLCSKGSSKRERRMIMRLWFKGFVTQRGTTTRGLFSSEWCIQSLQCVSPRTGYVAPKHSKLLCFPPYPFLLPPQCQVSCPFRRCRLKILSGSPMLVRMRRQNKESHIVQSLKV